MEWKSEKIADLLSKYIAFGNLNAAESIIDFWQKKRNDDFLNMNLRMKDWASHIIVNSDSEIIRRCVNNAKNMRLDYHLLILLFKRLKMHKSIPISIRELLMFINTRFLNFHLFFISFSNDRSIGGVYLQFDDVLRQYYKSVCTRFEIEERGDLIGNDSASMSKLQQHRFEKNMILWDITQSKIPQFLSNLFSEHILTNDIQLIRDSLPRFVTVINSGKRTRTHTYKKDKNKCAILRK